MFKHPEFKRNLILENSKVRLILVPSILFLVLWPLYSIDEVITEIGLKNIYDEIQMYIFWFTLIAGGIWGAKKSSDSILDEVNENTLIFQKFLPHKPLSFFFAKMFGATSFTWYCWLWGIIALIFHNVFFQWNYLYLFLVSLFLMTLTAQTGTHFLTLLTYFSDSKRMKKGSITILFILVIGILGFTTIGKPNRFTVESSYWYGMSFGPMGVQWLFLSYLSIWFSLGSYNGYKAVFRREYDHRYWLAFLVASPLFVYGFDFASKEKFAILTLLCLVFYTFVSFFCVLASKPSDLGMRILNRKLKSLRKNWLKLPAVFYPLCGLIISGVIGEFLIYEADVFGKNQTTVAIFAFVMFVIRDYLFYCAICLKSSTRFPRSYFFAYLFCVYYVFPAMISRLEFFYPGSSYDSIWISYVSSFVQMTIAALFLRSRIKSGKE